MRLKINLLSFIVLSSSSLPGFCGNSRRFWKKVIHQRVAMAFHHFLLFLTILNTVLSQGFSQIPLSNTTSAPPPTSICDLCLCDTGLNPILIDCSKRHLTSLFTENDWTYTMIKLNISVVPGSNISLDVRFDENELVKITKFSVLPIVSLSFRGNWLNEIEAYAFENLNELSSLDISSNRFTSKDLPEQVFEGKFTTVYFKPLTLQSLNMSDNKIHTIETDLFDHFPNLTSLDLSGNPLRTLGGSTGIAIADLQNLEYLNLAYTGIRDIPDGMIHSLLNLISLDLTGNNFSKMPHELHNAHNLSVLILDENKFESFDADSFKGLESLQELSISNMRSLRLIETRTFGELKKLLKLYCHHNRNLDRISNSAFYEIAENPEHWPIQELYLNDNALTHIDEALAAWKAIETIDIQNNPFRCNCDLKWMTQELVDQIRRTHPHLTQNIVCAEPKELKGGSILELGLEPESFSKCRPGGYSLNGQKLRFNKDGIDEYAIHQSAAVTVLIIGIILIVIGVSILGVIIVKRRAIASALISHQEIRYQRAEDEEFEQPSSSYRPPSSNYSVKF